MTEIDSTGQVTPFVSWLQERSQSAKIAIMAMSDAVILSTMVFLAYALRISYFALPPREKISLYLLGPILSILFAGIAGVYRSATRGYSASMERRLILSQIAVPIVWTAILLMTGIDRFARSTVLIYFTLAVLSMIVLRRVAYALFTTGLGQMSANVKAIPVIIYGAGQEGLAVAESLRRHGKYRPVAFLDTDYTLVDRTVAGLRVYPVERMSFVTKRWNPDEVIIAKPRQNRASRRKLVDMFIDEGMKVKIIPGHSEFMDGQVNIAELREINLEDLLGRDPVPPNDALMAKAIWNKVVMVTGAGGSIGSELVRQVVSNGAAKVIMVDNSEYSLFQIHREMESQPNASRKPVLVAALADVVEQPVIAKLMKENGVQVVFHAAAYKHVRMVQENAVAGIENNVWGTLAAAEAAIASGVERFILISTDKAVRPTSIMGASKRVAELVIQSLANENAGKRKLKIIFSMVRFGNVLGSTGSVVPIFKDQIAAGGPVLVTHREVTRYFMLIPEAAQLVIQAGAMAEGGEVFVLDMGEPVKIRQLAETMIELAGYKPKTEDKPNGDIEIRYIGLRDGEKMFEELQIGRETSPTTHPRILRSNEIWVRARKIARCFDQNPPSN